MKKNYIKALLPITLCCSCAPLFALTSCSSNKEVEIDKNEFLKKYEALYNDVISKYTTDQLLSSTYHLTDNSGIGESKDKIEKITNTSLEIREENIIWLTFSTENYEEQSPITYSYESMKTTLDDNDFNVSLKETNEYLILYASMKPEVTEGKGTMNQNVKIDKKTGIFMSNCLDYIYKDETTIESQYYLCEFSDFQVGK